MPIFLELDGAEVSTLVGDLTFNRDALSVLSCSINPAIGPGTATDKTLSTNLLQPGQMRFVIFGLSQTTLPDGVLFTCQFAILPGASTLSTDTRQVQTLEADKTLPPVISRLWRSNIVRHFAVTPIMLETASAADPLGNAAALTLRPGHVVVLGRP
jgi:hypothetical protein